MSKILSNNLSVELKKRNLTVSALAKLANVPKTNIQNWITGSNPDLEQLGKVADALGVSIEELALGKKPKSPVVEILEKLEIHNGLYEVSIKKVNKKVSE